MSYFFLSEPVAFRRVYGLESRGPAGNRTTTGSLSVISFHVVSLEKFIEFAVDVRAIAVRCFRREEASLGNLIF